ncbi:MAG: ribosome silencing factor [Oscillospiraceae bacterium]|nr:ribosome silencing factor [Oscillospiraceae bacterium]
MENKNMTTATPEELAHEVVRILDSKNAQGLTLLHVTDNTIITDYFVICTGNSNTQIKAFAGEVEFKLKEAGLEPRRTEGYREANWVVMDYASVIVHIFNNEQRSFYNLEKLWSDAVEVDISELVTEK